MARADRIRRRAARAAARGNTSRAENLNRRAGNVDTRRENLSNVISDPTQLLGGREDRINDRAAMAAGAGRTGRAERLAGRADAVAGRQEGAMSLWDDVSGQTAIEEAAEAQRTGIEDAATVMEETLDPYTDAGAGAVGSMEDLLGMNGPEAQAAAYEAIESSPGFLAQVQQGENAMLQNASATGGLRGGNTQGALAQLRPMMLSQAIGQQMGGLGGLAGMGSNAAGQMAGGLADLYGQQGDVNASEILGGYQTQRDFFGNLAGMGTDIARLIATGGF